MVYLIDLPPRSIGHPWRVLKHAVHAGEKSGEVFAKLVIPAFPTAFNLPGFPGAGAIDRSRPCLFWLAIANTQGLVCSVSVPLA